MTPSARSLTAALILLIASGASAMQATATAKATNVQTTRTTATTPAKANATTKADDAQTGPAPAKAAAWAARLAPRGCKVLSEVRGDLNADKVADSVLVLENNYDDEEDYPPRCLVVALKGKDNLYHRSAYSWSLLTPTGAGGASFGDPSLDITIKNGTLTVQELIGDNDRTSTTRKFRLQEDGTFREVGRTVLNYKSSSAEGESRDENLATGFVIVNTKPIIAEDDTAPPLEKFYQLRCEHSPLGLTECPNTLQKWPTIPVNLVTRDCIKQGASRWKGRADLSATLEGTHTEKYLFLRATVRDDHVNAYDEIVLRGANGNVIKPVCRSRTRTANGYIEERTYNGWEVQQSADVDDLHEGAFVYHISIDIVDSDRDGQHCVMSTGDARGKHTGELVLGKETLLQRL